MEEISLVKRLFDNDRFSDLARSIAEELANRGMFAMRDFPRFVVNAPQNDFTKKCTEFYSLIKSLLLSDGNANALYVLDPKPQWLRIALFPSVTNNVLNIERLAYQICIHLICMQDRKLDDHVENLRNTTLCESLGIKVNDDGLTSLSDKRLDLRRQGIIFDHTVAIYPHQFLRRYMTSNFVGMPSLLRRAHDKGLAVSLRIDPLRRTEAENYIIDGLVEADYWHGLHFSMDLLNDKYKGGTTKHASTGVHNLTYDAAFTLFRTKMMDDNLREISIEEYCPLILASGQASSAWGEKYYVQKFGHLVYNQTGGCFEHVDGAVRIFDPEEYDDIFTRVKKDLSVEEKIGERHKLFLVEGEIQTEDAQTLLNEWFRYNPHIQEYFCNVTVLPSLPYEVLENARKV